MRIQCRRDTSTDMKSLFIVAGLAAAFGTGFAAHALFFDKETGITRTAPPEESASLRAGDRSAASPSNETAVRRNEAQATESGTVRLAPLALDALIIGGGLESVISRMGFSPEESQEIAAKREAALERLKKIEADHSKVVTGADGESYAAISPFPAESARWLSDTEKDLRQRIPDDRAAVIARMIAAKDNDQNAGDFQREIRVTVSANQSGVFRIEERSFDAAGKHFDSDFETVDSRSKSRWSHLLDFGK